MITLTMTPQEVYEQMQKDEKELLRLNRAYVFGGGCKAARTCKTYPYIQMHEVRTSTGNLYLVMNAFRNRREAFLLNPSIARNPIVETSKGKVLINIVIRMETSNIIVQYFMPHLFRRYKERMGFKQDGIPLLRTFIKRNHDFVFHTQYRRHSKNNKTDVMFTCYDGAVFGYKHPTDPNSYVLMTFIANDTMQEGYKSKFNKHFNEVVADALDALEVFGLKDKVSAPVKLRK